MKIFNIVFGLLFVVSAGLQFNDPDPLLWIPLYLYTAVICFLAAGGRFYVWPAVAGLSVYVFYAIYLFFTDNGVVDWVTRHDAENIAGTMKAASPWIEDTREFFGLCILSFVLVFNLLYHRRRRLSRVV